ncbi:hypothetical protein D7319_03515 [Streptomyces radicis]|uniref:Uncharacterized protein n=1 Tax=Streptomyces radicis TaxID=1750517 RepID=A0A3A9X0L8_9ACTN|nr:hypothetical protein D7319_03515 [Streptomyces radicis]RKN25962.1 hypothetical protein D7318_06965 [Streptomyces radicis]
MWGASGWAMRASRERGVARSAGIPLASVNPSTIDSDPIRPKLIGGSSNGAARGRAVPTMKVRGVEPEEVRTGAAYPAHSPREAVLSAALPRRNGSDADG